MTIGRIPSVEGGIQPTIVDAKGDLIAGVAADSINRLAVGSNDQVLVADSSTSTGLAWKSYGFQALNPVINSGFDIWQRGTSISFAASTGAYAADRWYVQTQANQASTISRQATGDTTNLPFIQYCARVQRNSGQTGTGNLLFSQSLETTNAIPFAGKTVTMSFYARAGANFAGTLSAYLIAGTGTDQNRGPGTSYTGETYPVNGVTVSLTTTWQRFTFTGTLNATVTEFATYLNWACSGTAGANDYYEITGMQVDIGSVATPYKRAMNTLQGELAACQRYYYRNTPGNEYGIQGMGVVGSTTVVTLPLQLPVTMRVRPTSIDVPTTITNLQLTNWNTNSFTISQITLDQSTQNTATLQITSSGMTVGQAMLLRNNNSLTGFIGVNAEL